MKLHLLHKNLRSNVLFSSFTGDEFLKLWHYHPELELVYIVSGKGTLYVGDFIGNFESNNIFLIGSNIPHMFDSAPNFEGESSSIVVHLNYDFLKKLGQLGEEFNYINSLLLLSNRGLKFNTKESQKFKNLFHELAETSSDEKVLQTLKILYRLSLIENLAKLGSIEWIEQINIADDRINTVIEYIMMNFKNEIQLNEIAEMVAMNKTAFCRYFKQNTQKTFVNFLNGVRINYACKLLKENNASNTISMACYNSGFNSLSYFNRIFKKNIGCAPSEYR
ncbi:AraC-type DNA-binding protein [Maribacter sedimenticola]|uniref:AraC-type DNA-binding protein n=1 Tax=Maribacter sedimenticola TaxID=228956 RepID=A0ABY1SFB4_9FLAO|nr:MULTISPECIES: AraC family transcriptional regulator [Maribacter]TVZ14796.1 AraC-like DNA-binding protein [Maribacter sp. MAR_2009_72]SNR40234.1 AraC-type DNA-binding protein [Maribacter sedimenticola]